MDKVIAVLCVVVLAMTAFDGYDRITDEDNDENNKQEGQMSTITSVTVPEPRIGDSVQYDHEMLVEYRWENKTSGNYSFWALDLGGTETIDIISETSKKDGFGEQHNVVHLRRQLGGQFTVTADSSDDEPISAKGAYDIGRDEYKDLTEEKIVFTEADAWLEVEELPNLPMDVEFDGYMRSYFDPEEGQTETLEESILEDDRYIEVGDTGTYDYGIGEGWSIKYKWVAQQGEIISGYETLFINVTTDFGDENFSLPFQESLWFANKVSVPVKQFIRTSTYYEDNETLFYFIIENDFKLQVNGFTAGEKDIQWGTCGSTNHWHDTHPDGEFESWYDNYMPLGGSGFDESSFDFKPEDAITFLTTKDLETNQYPSEDLVEFLNSYNDVMVTRAEYSVEKNPAGDPLAEKKQGEYWWNLTFGHKRTDEDEGSSRDLPYRYQLLVKQTSTYVALPPPGDYEDVWEVEEDYGIVNGTSPFSNWDLEPDCITMTSCEEIMKSDEKVIEFFYTRPSGIEEDELNWGELEGTSFNLEVSDWGFFGMDMIGTLTGIEAQTNSDYYWTLSKEDLLEGGTLVSASVDAQTGRLISILYLKGTALQGALSE